MQMANILFNFFLASCVLVIFTGQGINGQVCSVGDLLIKQEHTGVAIHGKPEFKVSLQNKCVCPQEKVTLFCDGFQTAEAIDPKVLAVQGRFCLVKDGTAIGPYDSFRFTYAWDTRYPFKVNSTDMLC